MDLKWGQANFLAEICLKNVTRTTLTGKLWEPQKIKLKYFGDVSNMEQFGLQPKFSGNEKGRIWIVRATKMS